MKDLESMVNQYLETALWSSNDHTNGDAPLDHSFIIEDFAPESRALAEKDCYKFLELIGDLADGIDKHETDLGHDFWLTRNGHGAGFWDGDYPDDIGEKLTEISTQFGEINAIVGDDGKIYLEG